MKIFGYLVLAWMMSGTEFAYAGNRLYDGEYKTRFPDGCGILTVREAGQKIRYRFGPCGHEDAFRDIGSFDGRTLTIKKARLNVSSSSKNQIVGVWTHGPYKRKHIFTKQ